MQNLKPNLAAPPRQGSKPLLKGALASSQEFPYQTNSRANHKEMTKVTQTAATQETTSGRRPERDPLRGNGKARSRSGGPQIHRPGRPQPGPPEVMDMTGADSARGVQVDQCVGRAKANAAPSRSVKFHFPARAIIQQEFENRKK